MTIPPNPRTSRRPERPVGHAASLPEAASGLTVRRGQRHAVVTLGGEFSPAAQRHLHEALDWLFDTGTTAVRIEFTDDPPHRPETDRRPAAGAGWSRPVMPAAREWQGTA